MEKVSAMKKVALFLMIVGLAVALVACEGPVGTPGEKGEKGETGDPGTTGTTGTTGTPGVSALIATTADNATVLVSDKTVGSAPVFGDKPADFDVSRHFQGGTGDLAFTDSGEVEYGNGMVTDTDSDGVPDPDTTSYYTVKVTKAGMASLTVRDAAIDPDDADQTPNRTTEGALLVAFIVTATDESGRTADKTIVVQRNIAPVVVAFVVDAAHDLGADEGVGTQAVENPIAVDATARPEITTTEVTAAKELRPMLNQYRLKMMADTHFTDAEFAKLTFTAKSSAPAVASVTVDNDKQVIVITGLQGTDALPATATPAAPTITVTAIDAGDLESGHLTFPVVVRAAPVAAKDTVLSNLTVAQGGTARSVNRIASFFTPAGLTVTATSSRPTIATVPVAEITTANAALEITGVNVGSTTITVKATDVLTQYATREFTVTVTAPSS